MTGYKIISLRDMVAELGKDETAVKLSEYECPLNLDVEAFLRTKAITFDEQSLAATHLVYASYKDKPVLVGYVTLANKDIEITNKAKLSSTLRKRLRKFASGFSFDGNMRITAPLIAQLGKNFHNGYNKLISGDELLAIALSLVGAVHALIGGKVTYIECEDKPRLLEFYERSGFVSFGKRNLERDERDVMKGSCLVQMLKYMGKDD